MFSPSSRRHPYPFRHRLYNKLSGDTRIEKFMFRYLVGGASMPRSTELPDVLQPLARRQALVVGDHFHPDVDRLVAVLETVHGITPTSTVFAPAFTNSIGIEFVLIP